MISAVVLTRNEERHLPGCLATLHWADELLVVDSGSTDRTVELAYGAGARVVHHPFLHFGAQREAALRMASHPWVLFVDADERVPPSLAEAIRVTIEQRRPEVGWWIPRRNFFWGHEVRHSGWAPDYQLRLLWRDAARYDSSEHVHETARLDGPAGYLDDPLIHINYEGRAEFWSKQAQYARYESQRLAARGIQWKPRSVVLQPLRAFRRRYWDAAGWKDGLLGFQLATAMAWWEAVAYWRLREHKK